MEYRNNYNYSTENSPEKKTGRVGWPSGPLLLEVLPLAGDVVVDVWVRLIFLRFCSMHGVWLDQVHVVGFCIRVIYCRGAVLAVAKTESIGIQAMKCC